MWRRWAAFLKFPKLLSAEYLLYLLLHDSLFNRRKSHLHARTWKCLAHAQLVFCVRSQHAMLSSCYACMLRPHVPSCCDLMLCPHVVHACCALTLCMHAVPSCALTLCPHVVDACCALMCPHVVHACCALTLCPHVVHACCTLMLCPHAVQVRTNR